MDVRFIDDDHVAMRDRNKTMLMTRDKPLAKGAALDAKSRPAAYNGPKVRAGREGDDAPVARNVVPGPARPRRRRRTMRAHNMQTASIRFRA